MLDQPTVNAVTVDSEAVFPTHIVTCTEREVECSGPSECTTVSRHEQVGEISIPNGISHKLLPRMSILSFRYVIRRLFQTIHSLGSSTMHTQTHVLLHRRSVWIWSPIFNQLIAFLRRQTTKYCWLIITQMHSEHWSLWWLFHESHSFHKYADLNGSFEGASEIRACWIYASISLCTDGIATHRISVMKHRHDPVFYALLFIRLRLALCSYDQWFRITCLFRLSWDSPSSFVLLAQTIR